MLIPKNQMPAFITMLDFYLDVYKDGPTILVKEEDLEMIRRVHDRAALCLHGDANFLEIEVFYGFKPKPGV